MNTQEPEGINNQDQPVDEQTALEQGIRRRVSHSGSDAQDQVEDAVVEYQRQRVENELQDYEIARTSITPQEVASFTKLLDSSPDEHAAHQFLAEHPMFFVEAAQTSLSVDHVISKSRLGSEYVPDFLLSHMDSIGIHWLAVELESPRAQASRKDGRPRDELNKAVAQIEDWREWLSNNLDYARRSRTLYGLGLVGIDSRVPGLILIGRRGEHPARFNDYRKRKEYESHITIHSYDWLADMASKAIHR